MAYVNQSEPSSGAATLLLLESGDFILLESGDNIILVSGGGSYTNQSEPTTAYVNQSEGT